MAAAGTLTSKQKSNAKILILGDPSDPHTTVVCDALSLIGFSSSVLDIGSSWQLIPISLFIENPAQSKLFGTPEIRSVWLRWKPNVGNISAEDAFVLREKRDAIYGMIGLCEIKNLMNDPWNQDRSKNKVLQLGLAKSCGLSIPQTSVSNDAQTTVSYFGQQEIIYKPITWLATNGGEMIFTNTVSQELLKDNADTIALAPGLFQNLVPKRFEYRVTIVDEQLFTVRIHSQEMEQTRVDWRRNQTEVHCEVVKLPESIEAKLKTLMDKLGLRYSAVDLIETPDGEFVFLEANPVGNWLWLEERLGLKISTAIAHALSK
jgi:hypothetical protein